MIYNITHHDISFHKRNKNDSGRNKKNIILSNIRTLLGTINGHTWLGLLIIPVDYTGAVIYLIYINLILFFRSLKNINQLLISKKIEVG